MRKCSMLLVALIGFSSSAFAEEGKRPLKVYILVGQSNMQGHAKVSTLPAMAWDPVSKELYGKFVDGAGEPRVYDDVQVAAFSEQGGWGGPKTDTEKVGALSVGYGSSLADDSRFGPELGFGVTMLEHLDEPVLIIKTSWGGKSLHTDFRSPSGGPYYEFPEEVQERKTHKGEIISAEKQIADKVEATGKYYRLMVKHVKTVLADPGKCHAAYDEGAGYELAGFVWFQGFNDMVGPYPVTKTKEGKKGPKDYSLYSRLLASFIRDVRKDLGVPKLPFVIGVIGVGGNPDEPHAFREAMAAPAELPEFKGNVVAVHTAELWDHRLSELSERFKVVTSQKNSKAEDQYAGLREKLSLQLKEYTELNKLRDEVLKKIKGAKAKGGGLSPEELKTAKQESNQYWGKIKEMDAEMRKVIYTDEEEREISVGRGNQAYHYLGSAKIYGRIGEALAKGMARLDGVETAE